MKTTIQGLIHKNGLVISVYFILAAVVFISIVSIVVRNQIVENSAKRELLLDAQDGVDQITTYINLADMGLRGFIVDQNEAFLGPFNDAVAGYQGNFENLRVMLDELGYDVSKMNKPEVIVHDYMILLLEMADMCRVGDVQAATDILKRDPGADAYAAYSPFIFDAGDYINQLSLEAEENYRSLTMRMVVIQILLLVFGGPVLVWTALSLRKAQKHRAKIYDELAQSNNQYIFDPGEEESEETDETKVINSIIDNLKHTADFISNITKGNYDVIWEGMNDKNAELNTSNIAGELTTMRDQMKKVKTEDEKRIWISQGLSDFATIIRNNQNDFKILSEELITNVVKYLKVQMGGLFIVNHDDEDEVFLELTGCYAYSRVKTLEKTIKPGKGLIGQSYIEGETIYLKDVPQEFVNITSGLGDTRPSNVLIVPLKLNSSIEGVIELASLKEFADHEIEFVEKLGETLASAITTVRSAEQTKVLLEQTQQQAEEMRAQEEEMRQNMEELEATQEDMQRQKEELEMEKVLMDALLHNVPEFIYFKDRESKFIRNSTSHAKLFGFSNPKDLVGKSDFDFFTDEHARPAYESEQNIIKTGEAFFNLVEKEVKKDGTVSYVSTSKMPLINKDGEIIGTYGISKDITDIKKLEEEMKQQNQELKEQEEEMRQNMEELLTTQDEMHRQKEELEIEKTLMDALMHNVPEFIYFKDRDSKFLRNSTSHAKLFGFENPKDLIGKSDFDFFTDEHARPAFESEQNIIKTGEAFFNLVEKEVKKDGTVSYVSTSKMPLVNQDGEIIGTYGISKDITDIKMLEEEMKLQNQELTEQEKVLRQNLEELETEQSILTTLMNLLPERITIKDSQGKYLKLSQSKYATLKKQGHENVIGKSDKDIFGATHFNKSFSVEKELMKTKKPVLDVEEKIKISEKASIWGLTSRVPFLNTTGKVLGTIAITRDITKEKLCQEELTKLKGKS